MIKKLILVITIVLFGSTAFGALSTSRPRLWLNDDLIQTIGYRGGYGTESSYAQSIRDAEVWESHKSVYDTMHTTFLSTPDFYSFKAGPQMLALGILWHLEGNTTYRDIALTYLDTYADNQVVSGVAVRPIAIGYDLFYDELSAGDKERLQHVMQVSTYNRYIQTGHTSVHGIWNGHRLTDEEVVMFPYAYVAIGDETLTDATYNSSPLSATTYGTAWMLSESQTAIGSNLRPALAQVAGANGGSHMGIGTYGIHAWTALEGPIIWKEAGMDDYITDWSYSDGIKKHFLYMTSPHKYGGMIVNDDADNDWHTFTNTLNSLLVMEYLTTDETTDGAFTWLVRHATGSVYSQHQAYYLMFHDPVSSLSPPVLDDVMYQDGLGTVIYKSGFDTTPTAASDNYQILFKSADYFDGHSHYDQNSFQIAYKGDLAIYSGDYPNDTAGDHYFNYYTRTIAGNTMLFDDPAETCLQDNSTSRPCDGGQEFIWGYNSTEDSTTSRPQDFGDVSEGSDWDISDTLSYDNNDMYIYIQADATRAYEASKTSEAIRGMYLLKDTKDLIIVDYTGTPAGKASSVTKKFLLHGLDFPVVTGNVDTDNLNAYGGGDITYSSLSSIKFTDVGNTYGSYTHTGGDGKLFLIPVLPADVKAKVIGGPADDDGRYQADSNEFYYGSTQQNITSLDDNTPPTGVWRTELSHTSNEADQLFFNLIHITDSDVDVPVTVAIASASVTGVQIKRAAKDSLVLTSLTSTLIATTASAVWTPSTTNATEVSLLNVAPGDECSVVVTGTAIKTVTVDFSGTGFTSSAGSTIVISVSDSNIITQLNDSGGVVYYPSYTLTGSITLQ